MCRNVTPYIFKILKQIESLRIVEFCSYLSQPVFKPDLMGLVFSHSLVKSSPHIKEAWIKGTGEEVLDDFRGRELDGIIACSINARLSV